MKNKNKYIFSLIALIVFLMPLLFMLIKKVSAISVNDIINILPKNIYISVLWVIIFYILKSISIIFPISLLNIVCGTIFDLKFAIIINIIGGIIVTTVPYCIGFFTNEKWAIKIQNKYEKINQLENYRNKNQIWFTYLTRAVGFLPCDILSWYMGNRRMNYFKYTFGSFLGMFPATIINTIFGDKISNGITKDIIIFAVILILFTVFISYTSNKLLNKLK